MLNEVSSGLLVRSYIFRGYGTNFGDEAIKKKKTGEHRFKSVRK